MKLAASQQLYDYWNELRGARSAPERNDVDPGAIRGVLADTFILEFDPRRAFPIRIVGTRTNALFQKELRATPFLDLWRAEDRAEARAILTAVADEAQPFLIGALGAAPGFAPIEFEALLLPLRHHGDTHARLLGCCAPGAPPRWLGLATVAPLALLTLRALGRDESPRRIEPRGNVTPLDFARARRLRRHGHLFHTSGER